MEIKESAQAPAYNRNRSVHRLSREKLLSSHRLAKANYQLSPDRLPRLTLSPLPPIPEGDRVMDSCFRYFAGREVPDFGQWKALLGIWAPIMKNTPQRSDYHAEGNVLIHTEMVCNAMTRLEAF